jgi:hypothetical protein
MFEEGEQCDRYAAMCHGDAQFVQITCTCGQCADAEAAGAWMDWLAEQDPSLDVQQRWYDVLRLNGYALPENIWRHVQAWISSSMADDAEMAERLAGWDPNP